MQGLLGLIAPPLCAGCGGDAGRASPLCRECRGALRPAPSLADGVWAAFAYDGPAGAMVRSLKFGGRIGIADAMAAQIAAHVPRTLLAALDAPGSEPAALVPVPVHPAHRRRRGFNHARALADALARRTGSVVCDCLIREGDARPQVGRGRRERMAGVAGLVRVHDDMTAFFADGSATQIRWLLVDDVVTTGATLTACALALRDAGAVHVRGIAYAATAGR